MGVKSFIVSMLANPNKVGAAVSAISSVGGMVKGWIFSDGKFNCKRAVIMIAGGVTIGVGYAYLPPEIMDMIFDKLDLLSDMIGYADRPV